jgi:hypothetical protein
VPADGAPVTIVRNTGVPMLPPPPGLAIPQARPPAHRVSTTGAWPRSTIPLADFPGLRRPTITAAHTRHSATFMAPDHLNRAASSNAVRASTTSMAPDRPNRAAGSNAVRASTTSMAPDRSHRAAGHNGVQTSTATGRRALIPTARAAEANRQAQDATAHRLAARDQRGRRAEARVLQAEQNAIMDRAGDDEATRYLRGAWTACIPCL